MVIVVEHSVVFLKSIFMFKHSNPRSSDNTGMENLSYGFIKIRSLIIGQRNIEHCRDVRGIKKKQDWGLSLAIWGS